VHSKIIGRFPYWTSCSDENCEGTYGWCDLDLPFPKWLPWEKGQPIHGGGGGLEENCNTLVYDMGYTFNVFFDDRGCYSSDVKFICEVRTYENMGNLQ
jgi:hypothetical protein